MPAPHWIVTFGRLARTLKAALAALGLLAAGAAGACAGSAAAGAHGGEPGYTTAYAAGDHDAALREASIAARSGPPDERAEAALIAGLSAHALGRDGEARTWLEPLTGHEDPAVSGRASAALGLMAQKQGDHERAATLLGSASERLAGDQAARAAMYAGDSRRAQRRLDEAAALYARAQQHAADPLLKRAIADRLAGGAPAATSAAAPAAPAPAAQAGASGAYTLQLGAFASANRAHSLARNVAPRARAVGLGDPRVVPGLDAAGRRLLFVRVGRFPSRSAAADARSRLALHAIVTEAAGE